MSENDNSKWLMEEYRLLSAHYFHEDNYYLKSNTLFITLNGAMLGLISGNWVGISVTSMDALLALTIIGLISSLMWGLTLLRVHAHRCLIEIRIEEIESAFTDMLKIRNQRPAPPFYARIPASLIMLIMPSTFFLIWVYQLYARV